MPRFQPRIRKQKARRRAEEAATVRPQSVDTNALEILPSTQKASVTQRNGAQAAAAPKISRKKQKRLDKYIETKLKKEESLELLKKLAANKVDTSLLRSSRTLGIGHGTKHDALVQRLKEVKAGTHVEKPEVLQIVEHDSTSETGSELSSEWSGIHSDDQSAERSVTNESTHAPQTMGSGLKRPMELDATGMPIIRKRQKVMPTEGSRTVPFQFPEDSESDQDSGSSEASEDISTDDEPSDIDSESESIGSHIDDDDAESHMLTAALFAVNSKEQAEAAERAAARRAQAKSMMEEWQNEAQGFHTEPSNIEALKSLPQDYKAPKPRPLDEDPLPESLHIKNPDSKRKAYSIAVERPAAVQESRIKLSIVAEEQKIMEAIHNHSTVIVCGATGSGKTTQVPQFLFEAGYGSSQGPMPGIIGVTQPRRVAAVAMAKRVAEELGSASNKVSYQIRFDSTVDHNTAIKFMTDGILIREIADDFSLSKYSAIVIDEAHERSVNTDILIGMISRIVDLRLDMNTKDPKVTPLKLIIMSATLKTADFAANKTLFRRELPPTVEAEGRQYRVVEHFARRTQRDYLEQAYQKITRGHRKLPPGSMLVFLTGQNEINTLARRLSKALSASNSRENGPSVRVSGKEVPIELEDYELGEDRVDDYSYGNGDMEESEDEAGEREDEGFDLDDDDEPGSAQAQILPLFSQLPTKEQLRVFEPPPPNTRLIILATNVAETSITIPGIRYVFDCGRSKQKKYNHDVGVYNFEIGWISKASAQQRLGRAGRTGPGHCYRLYSSAMYESFANDSSPEIVSTPLESVVLQLKSMDLQQVANFPFPTPPERSKISQAERLLGYIGALDQSLKITSIGRALSLYPVSPRFAKMLAIGHQHECIYLTTALVAALATPELFVAKPSLELKDKIQSEELYDQTARLADDARDERRRAYGRAHSQFAAVDPMADALKLLSAFCGYLWTTGHERRGTSEDFCAENFLQPKRLGEASQLYHQLLSILALHHPGSCNPRSGRSLALPTSKQITALKQFVAAGFLDQVAIRADLAPVPPATAPRSRSPTDVPYLTLFPSHEARSSSSTSNYKDVDPYVYIHASSVLAHCKSSQLPPFIIYSALQKGSPRVIAADGTPALGRTRMLPLVPVTGTQLQSLARGTPLLELGKPVGKIELLDPAADAKGRVRERRAVWVVPSIVGRAGDHGGARRAWPLPVVKLVQMREAGGGWKEVGEAK